MSWGDLKKRYDLKSTTRSFGATALGLAILGGRIALTDKVTHHHPGFGTPPQSNAQTGWIDRITILHLASQTAGFEKSGGWPLGETAWQGSIPSGLIADPGRLIVCLTGK